MPGCRLLLPPSLRHSNRTDSATNTAASWPPANKDSFRALLYNSTAELGAPISFVKQSVQSGQDFFLLSHPAQLIAWDWHRHLPIHIFIIPHPLFLAHFSVQCFPKIDILMFTCQKTAFYATDVYHTAYDVYWWHQIKKKGGTFMKPVWANIVGLFTDYG